MTDLLLEHGARVSVAPPILPRIEVAPPSPTSVVVLPVAGPRGPRGDSGAGYEHVQAEPSDTWIVDHNLGRCPSGWSLYDLLGRECSEYVVTHPTTNRAVVRMDVPTAGLVRMI